MNGTSHAIAGATTGFIVANNYQVDPGKTILLIGIGGITGLVPDLDVGGKLRSRLTIPQTYIRHIAQLIGILLLVYSFFKETDTRLNTGVAIGAGVLLFASMFKPRHMLLITSICVLGGGYFLQEKWLLLFGLYIFVASISSHRTYTHSLIGLCFFGLIGYFLEQSVIVEGIFYTCLFSYGSHLVMDSALFPFNKRGVPLFLPLTKKEI